MKQKHFTLIELLVVIAMIAILFILKRKPWATNILLLMTISLGVLNIVQLILEINLERFFLMTIFSILIWAFDTFLIANQIYRKKKLKKFIKDCEELQKLLTSMYPEK